MSFNKAMLTAFLVFLVTLAALVAFGPDVHAGAREGAPRTIFIDTAATPRGRMTDCRPQANRFIRYNVGDEIILATDNGRGTTDEVLATYTVERVAFPKSIGTGDRGECYLPHSRIEQVVYVRSVTPSGD